MAFILNNFYFGHPDYVRVCQGNNLNPTQSNRVSTTALMGSDAVKPNIVAAAELYAKSCKWQVIAVSSGVNRSEKGVTTVGANTLEVETVFQRTAVTWRATNPVTGATCDRTLWYTSENNAEEIHLLWPQVSATDVSEKKIRALGDPCFELFTNAVSLSTLDHVVITQTTCSATTGGASPKSDAVTLYGQSSTGIWTPGYTLTKKNYSIQRKTSFAGSYTPGTGVYQAASGLDTATGTSPAILYGQVVQEYDAHYVVCWGFNVDRIV